MATWSKPIRLCAGDSMDSEGEMNHQSDGAIDEQDNLGKLKDDQMEVEMEVDAGVPQVQSADIKKHEKEGD